MTDFGKRVGHRYVDRGDPSAADFLNTDLTTDGAWHDLDLSSIVPAGAVSVHLRVDVKDDAAYNYIQFRKSDNSNLLNMQICMEMIANLSFFYGIIVSCNSDRFVEYYASNTTFTSINIVIRGWFI